MSVEKKKKPVAGSSDDSETESSEESESSFALGSLVQNLPESSDDVAAYSGSTVEDALQSFRYQWIAELDSRSKEDDNVDDNHSMSAENLSGQKSLSEKPNEQLNLPECIPQALIDYKKNRPEIDTSDEVSCTDLGKILQQKIMNRGSFFELENTSVGFPTIVDIPLELLSVIVRYVVGNELDIISLETLALVSSEFYLLARDSETWYLICRRIFSLSFDKMSYSIDWRQMFITVPHLYFHGVYIGKCSYIRHGETSFQDQFYRPCHIIVYYRHLRFFADGTVIMLTSSEHPSQTVSLLKSKKTRCSGTIFGSYEFLEDCIILKFCRRHEPPQSDRGNRRKESFVPHGIAKQDFTIQLQFGSSKKCFPHRVLQWNKYDCHITYFTGETSDTSFDVMDKRYFPSLFFSRVKSYVEPDGWCDILE